MARVYVLAALCVAAILGGASAAGVSDAELMSFSRQLFELDQNALAKTVNINLQGKTFSSDHDDKAPGHLLAVNGNAAKAANTNVALLARLYDNYVPDATVAEHETPQEKQEQSDLLDGLMASPVLAKTLDFLASKGLVPNGRAAQKQFLHKLWFSLYSRGGRNLGSSAFEHVFLGELKKGDVSGMHSWLYYKDQEAANKIDYKGWIKKLDLGNSGTLLKVRFSWLGANKPVNSLFVGATPELEMSLYTLCFMSRPGDKCWIASGNKEFHIQTWPWSLRDGFQTIGSAYPAL